MEERQVSPLESEHWETRMKTLLRENSESHELEERLQALLAANNEKLIQRITRTLAPEWISDGETVSEATEEVSTLQPPSKGPSLRSGTVDRTSGTSAVNRTSGASAVNRTSGASAVSHPSVSHNASAETVNVDELEGINEEEEEEGPEQRERKMRQSITSLNSADERAYKSALVKQQDRQHRRDQVLASSGSSGLSKAKETCLEANRRVVASWSFETFFAVCIFSNAVFIGVEVQYASLNRTSRLPDIFFVLDQTYAGIFLLELLLRFLAEGLPFFWSSPNLVWNYLDMLINFTSLLNLAAVIGQGIGTEDVVSAGNMRVVRILRLTRVIRVVRIVKIVRFIRALRSLVLSILGTLKVLLWSVLLLFMILYVFGIVFTDVSNEYSGQNQLEEISTESIDFLQQHFYDLERTMQTLFQSICNGNSWGVVADNLNKISRLWGYLYLTYVAFCLFAVLNVMTGMFCQSAIESAERDQELHIQSALSTKQQQIETFVKIFELLQKDRRRHHSDKVTFADFQHLFDDPRIRVFFQALDVETKDAWTLFKLMDTSGNGDLDVEEFVEGCMKLKGPARSVDVSLILQEHRRLRKKILSMEQVLLEVRTRMRKPEQGEKVFSM